MDRAKAECVGSDAVGKECVGSDASGEGEENQNKLVSGTSED